MCKANSSVTSQQDQPFRWISWHNEAAVRQATIPRKRVAEDIPANHSPESAIDGRSQFQPWKQPAKPRKWNGVQED